MRDLFQGLLNKFLFAAGVSGEDMRSCQIDVLSAITRSAKIIRFARVHCIHQR